MSEKAEGGLSYEIDNDKVICPNCCHQFRAIPVNVQKALQSLSPEREAGELVAWRYRYKGTTHWKYVDHENECNLADAYERQPIYAALKPAAGNEGMVSVPESLARALRNWSGYEPSQSVLAREVDAWLAALSGGRS